MTTHLEQVAADLAAELEAARAIRPRSIDTTSIAACVPGYDATAEAAAEVDAEIARVLAQIKAIDRADDRSEVARAIDIGALINKAIAAKPHLSLQALVKAWKGQGRLSDRHGYASLRRKARFAQATELHVEPFVKALGLRSLLELAGLSDDFRAEVLPDIVELIRVTNTRPVTARAVAAVIDAHRPKKAKAKAITAPEPATISELPRNVITLDSRRRGRVLKTVTQADISDAVSVIAEFARRGDIVAIGLIEQLKEALPAA